MTVFYRSGICLLHGTNNNKRGLCDKVKEKKRKNKIMLILFSACDPFHAMQITKLEEGNVVRERRKKKETERQRWKRWNQLERAVGHSTPPIAIVSRSKAL